MSKFAARPIYGKNPLKSSLEPKGQSMTFGDHWGCRPVGHTKYYLLLPNHLYMELLSIFCYAMSH